MEKNQYFYRCSVFTRKDNQIALADVYNPANITVLEEWLGIGLSLADGQHTLQEFIDYMKDRYDTPPENLEDTLHSVIERLIDGKMLGLSDKPVELPYYLASPMEELDLEKAKQLIQQDGYVFH